MVPSVAILVNLFIAVVFCVILLMILQYALKKFWPGADPQALQIIYAIIGFAFLVYLARMFFGAHL